MEVPGGRQSGQTTFNAGPEHGIAVIGDLEVTEVVRFELQDRITGPGVVPGRGPDTSGIDEPDPAGDRRELLVRMADDHNIGSGCTAELTEPCSRCRRSQQFLWIEG